MTNFGMKVAEGLGVAGWIIGLLAGLGVFFLVIVAVIYAILAVFDEEDKEDNEGGDYERKNQQTGA